jgi:uncharacterized protein YceH (UPF0502 family)
MSIAQAQKQRELEQRVSELEQVVKELSKRVEAIENKPRPGRPPKETP